MSLVVVTAALALALTVLSSLVGLRIGRRLRDGVTDTERAQLYGVQASLLGILALLLGFSFAMGETRYDLRKQLVVEEANAVGTARLRASVIGGARGLELERLLGRYVTVRLEGYRARDAAGLHAALDESERLQRHAWKLASAIAAADPRSLPAALLLESLNQVIDLHAARVAAGRNHIPMVVLFMLLAVAAVAMGWVGAGIGVSSRHGLGMVLVLSLIVSLVIAVIVDLDQPRSGLVRIDQTTLGDLQRSFR